MPNDLGGPEKELKKGTFLFSGKRLTSRNQNSQQLCWHRTTIDGGEVLCSAHWKAVSHVRHRSHWAIVLPRRGASREIIQKQIVARFEDDFLPENKEIEPY